MHLYGITRGIKHETERYINDLQAQYFGYAAMNGQNFNVQLSVRPIQLWEFVFPKEHFNEVLATVSTSPIIKLNDWRSKYLAGIRIALKAKKIPNDIDLTKIPGRTVYKNNVAFYPIGIRDDEIWEEGHPLA